MTTKDGQMTNESSQKPRIKPAHDVVIEQAFELETLRTEAERLRIELEQARDAIRWLWGFWDGNTLIASPGADRGALDEAWDRLLRVLK